MSQKNETAIFAQGCFWGVEDYFDKIKGVIETKVGYCGGDMANPTYQNLCDHTESIRIIFDPEKISYQQLLEHFWKTHNPTANHKTQYTSAIFTTGPEQLKEAMESAKKEQKKYDFPVITRIEPLKKFYLAEEYHQKYIQKSGGAAYC